MGVIKGLLPSQLYNDSLEGEDAGREGTEAVVVADDSETVGEYEVSNSAH